MARIFFLAGTLFAALSVAIGAYGAHTEMIDEVQLLWLEKGARYQMYHAFGLILVSLVLDRQRSIIIPVVWAGFCFLGGIILFCGSLYLMAFTTFNAGYITPLGGISFLFGWLLFALGGTAGKKRRK